MVVSRTPLRLSFAGGGSDLPAFYREEVGGVVSTAIRKYVRVAVSARTDGRVGVSPRAPARHLDELPHALTREALRSLAVNGGYDIRSSADVPTQGTGLGSSSSYTVGLLHALHAARATRIGPEALATAACAVEIGRCGKPIGKQDQYMAAYGGLKYLQFYPDESVRVETITCPAHTRATLEQHLLLLYTGMTRSADPILSAQQRNLARSRRRRQMLRRSAELARDLRDALAAGQCHTLGEVLHEAWMIKRGMADGISSPQIDRWYNCARSRGAVGGKLAGAGGGGFLLLYAPPDAHHAICLALPALRRVAVGIEADGSTILHPGNSEGRHDARP